MGLVSDIAAFDGGFRPQGDLSEAAALSDVAVSASEAAIKKFPLSRYRIPPDVSTSYGGELSLVKAGCDYDDRSKSRYADLVRSFDWRLFHRSYDSFFVHFREMIMREYDVVIIDSRTGLTDIGGIRTRVMPKKLVDVFVPCQQNIDGIVNVLGSGRVLQRLSRS